MGAGAEGHKMMIFFQVESTEGEKGWKEVEDKPASKHPGFSQVRIILKYSVRILHSCAPNAW